MTPNAPTVAIIGGGALGAALLAALVERLAPKSSGRASPRIVLFEKGESVGRGVAYANDRAPYLLNQSAQTMSLVPGRRTHFFEWLEARGLARAADGDHFCARELFGAYAEEHVRRALEGARRRGIGASTVRGEVTSLTPRAAGGYRIAATGHAPVDADVAILAVGNLPSTRFQRLAGPRFVASPYPSAALTARIPPRSRVAILGSGLTAIDAALALFAAGHEGPVTMASRHGLLPAVRGPLHPFELAHVTRANIDRATDHGRRPLRWGTIVRWLELELEGAGHRVAWDRDFPAAVDPLTHLSSEIAAASRGARAWQSIGEALNPVIDLLWRRLADDDRLLFADQLRSRIMSYWVPIPLVTARRLLPLLREAQLSVEGGLDDVTLDADGAPRLHFADRSAPFDFVVDATGVPRHLHETNSPLLEALARQGTVDSHPFGGVRVDFESLRVVGAGGRPDASLFAIGNLTSGTHLFTSTLEHNVEKADRVAAFVADEIHRRTDKTPHVHAPPHSS